MDRVTRKNMDCHTNTQTIACFLTAIDSHDEAEETAKTEADGKSL